MIDLVQLRNDLTRGLEDAVLRAVKRVNTDSVIAHIDQVVKFRTRRGEFLEGSSPGAGRYRAASHIKARETRGRQIERADLFFEGNMLRATRGQASVDGPNLVIEWGYIEGQSEEEAMTLARYHSIDGAGRNHFLRVFIGITRKEGDVIVAGFSRRFGDALEDEWRT